MNWYLAVLKNYAGFSGRARRQEYWMFVLFNALIGIVLSVGGNLLLETPIPYVIYLVATLVPALAVAIRRLHDTGRSGWWVLIALVPLVGAIILLVFLASDGEQGENQYGANPKLAPAAA